MLSHAIPRDASLSQFMGMHQTRFDTKGRVSVPAPFRAVLRAAAADGSMPLVLRTSHTHPCIEGWPASSFESLAPAVDRLDIFSNDQDDFLTALYADAWPVEPDKEGRISVPDSLVQHAGLTDSVVFMGLGKRFQMWQPEAAARRIVSAREGVVQRGVALPAARP
jgi:MraZ protein